MTYAKKNIKPFAEHDLRVTLQCAGNKYKLRPHSTEKKSVSPTNKITVNDEIKFTFNKKKKQSHSRQTKLITFKGSKICQQPKYSVNQSHETLQLG